MRSHAKASSAGSSMRQPTHLMVGLLVAALTLLSLVPTASAFTTRPKIAEFGSDGTAASTFRDPESLAFDQAKDRLYVVDRAGLGNGPNTLYAFDAPAHTLSGGAFPLSVPVDAFDPYSLAVDNSAGGSAGNIYYVSGITGFLDVGNIYGFKADGSELNAGSGFPNFPIEPPSPKALCGIAVDSVGDIWVADGGFGGVRKYDSSGSAVSSISTAGEAGYLCQVTLDSNGDLFVATGANAEGATTGIWKYSAADGYSTAAKIDSNPTNALALDTSIHRLYAVQQVKGGGSATVAAFEADGTRLYEFATGIPKVELTSVAVDQGADQVYVSDTGSGFQPQSPEDKVYVYGQAQSFPDATATPVAPKTITDVSAEIGATITDNSVLPTNWRLELSADGGSIWKAVASGQTAGGQTNTAVSGSATGLTPNSEYKFRVVTNKGTSAETEVTSSALTFKTVAPPPVVSDLGVVEIGDTSMRLVATIDPRNTEAGYTFEYGTTPALGSSTAPVSVGGGSTPLTVSQVVGGLSPDTTYYFRAVATNLIGTTVSPSRTAHTRATPLPLPENRRYEMVTPPDKNLGSADQPIASTAAAAGIAQDGNSVAFCTGATFGDPPPDLVGICGQYLSRRTPGGWETVGIAPPFCGGNATGSAVFLSPNFDRAAVAVDEAGDCAVPPLDPNAPLPGRNLYRQDMTVDPFDYELLAPRVAGAQGGSPGAAGQAIFTTGSEDFSHIVYQSQNNQTDPPDSPDPGFFSKVYEWHNGSVSLVSKDVDNVPFATPSNLANVFLGEGQGVYITPPGAVSTDGSRIFFQNVASASGGIAGANACSTSECDLYLRENASTTIKVSESECSAECGVDSTPDPFMWATPNGEKAFFESCAKLTDASAPSVTCSGSTAGFTAGKLYRWDRNAAPGHRLVDVSLDGEPADGIQPRVRAVVGASDDGDVVYFMAYGQLVSGKPTDTQIPKIYRWDWNGGSPKVEYLDSFDPSNFKTSDELNWSQRRDRVTPDGKYLLISTYRRLDTAVDRDADKDIYRWGVGEGWLCISCQRPGVNSAGDATVSDTTQREMTPFGIGGHFFMPLGSTAPTPVISADGQRVFFDTPDALVPQDVNGEASCPLGGYPDYVLTCSDVYEWHDGTISLISGGTSSQPSYLIGTTDSGNDVMFFTRQRLVGWDTDNGVDIYDARLEGGFPEPPAQPPSCEAEACRGTGSGAPATTGAGTAAFQGPGNPAPQHRKGRKRHKKHHRKRHPRAAKQDRHPRAASQDRRIGR